MLECPAKRRCLVLVERETGVQPHPGDFPAAGGGVIHEEVELQCIEPMWHMGEHIAVIETDTGWTEERWPNYDNQIGGDGCPYHRGQPHFYCGGCIDVAGGGKRLPPGTWIVPARLCKYHTDKPNRFCPTCNAEGGE